MVREVLRQIVEILVEFGNTAPHYFRALAEHVTSLGRTALLGVDVAWYLIVLAFVLVGVLWWVHRL